MGIDAKLQFRSENGCVYSFDKAENCWYVYEIKKTGILPADVIKQVRDLQENAEALKDSLKAVKA